MGRPRHRPSGLRRGMEGGKVYLLRISSKEIGLDTTFLPMSLGDIVSGEEMSTEELADAYTKHDH